MCRRVQICLLMLNPIILQFKVQCKPCKDQILEDGSKCERCSYEDTNVLEDPFYKETVRPLMYFCATILVLVGGMYLTTIGETNSLTLFEYLMIRCFQFK
jgi:hypothetical protein